MVALVVRSKRFGRQMPTVSHNSARLRYFAIALSILHANPIECFSVPSASSIASTGRIKEEQIINHIKSIIIDSNKQQPQEELSRDASSIPIKQIRNELHHNKNIIISFISYYASDFSPTTKLSASEYEEFTTSRHTDCINLFDNYETNLIRCEKLNEQSINIRWKATWIPSGSTWLYNFATDFARWRVDCKSPDPAIVSTFSWKAVFDTFSTAFVTGNITLPISCVEGNTVLTIKHVEDEADSGRGGELVVTIKESIDLVSEADKNRIQNRRVAQELASWLDVSRRPPKFNVDDWAGMVRQRILTSVPGAGALDVDPNESDAEGAVALLLFGIISIVVFGISFQFFTMPELVGGTGSIPSRCDDAEILEFGSGYLSECFGPFGDPTL
jgi:hypothetical protein